MLKTATAIHLHGTRGEEMPSNHSLLGAAGEHYVMAELLRRGYIAALAPQGVPTADIIVTDDRGGRLCSIQVKTRRDIGSDGGWHMQVKHENIFADALFYCFVNLGKTMEAQPVVHVIPSKTVAEALRFNHIRWLAKPGRSGRPHKDNPLRRLLPDYVRSNDPDGSPYGPGWLDRYLNAWELLKLDARDPEVVAQE